LDSAESGFDRATCNLLTDFNTYPVHPSLNSPLTLGELSDNQHAFEYSLEPRKMMGEVSEGRLFDIGYADGLRPVLAVPEKEVPNGSRAG
jgi:hypothetical protein